MSGHNEKEVSSNKLILRDNAGLAYDAAEIGTVILSGPKLYLNDGTGWKLITSA